MQNQLITAIHLKKYFNTPRGLLHAVDDINFEINKGETLGVVGESGCGKTTLGRMLVRLLKQTSGEVLYNNENIFDFSAKKMLYLRKKIQIIFQDPYSSLNPRFSVSELIAEPLIVTKSVKRSEIKAKVTELMDTVGLAERFVNSYPHELDGGRRQRIGVARALSVDPDFIVCDEPVSALDVSIQAQIINLLIKLRDNRNLTYMFISHDLSVVKHISNNIMVMYLGKCVEYSSTDDLFERPLHPYTQALLHSIPKPSIREEDQMKHIIKGEVTSPINPPLGCRFASRCPMVTDKCMGSDIPLREINNGHKVACVLYE